MGLQQTLKALSDPIRREILNMLKGGRMSAGDITERFEVTGDKAQTLREQGINPYPYKFEKTASAKELQEKYKNLADGEETEDRYKVAGRVMAIRNSGMFIDLMDDTGKIQIFSHKQNIDPEKIKLLKLVDIGDIMGFEGDIRVISSLFTMPGWL